jgi:amino-acid N-acetyltransferase
MKIVNAKDHTSALVQLLQTEKLPVDDLPEQLDGFIAIIENDKLIGAAGIERYGDYGLLRSVVVSVNNRGEGIAAKLLDTIESRAKENGIKALFLLTETAADYFGKKSYHTITRNEVPEAVQQSSEFSQVCPVSAIVMKKNLF